jgi:hypothetical protein
MSMSFESWAQRHFAVEKDNNRDRDTIQQNKFLGLGTENKIVIKIYAT